ncbi:MAG: hypothetical protein N3A02_05175, partial [Rectinema sp.]|nr:hypothetical protein [Rectinema sp.]
WLAAEWFEERLAAMPEDQRSLACEYCLENLVSPCVMEYRGFDVVSVPTSLVPVLRACRPKLRVLGEERCVASPLSPWPERLTMIEDAQIAAIVKRLFIPIYPVWEADAMTMMRSWRSWNIDEMPSYPPLFAVAWFVGSETENDALAFCERYLFLWQQIGDLRDDIRVGQWTLRCSVDEDAVVLESGWFPALCALAGGQPAPWQNGRPWAEAEWEIARHFWPMAERDARGLRYRDPAAAGWLSSVIACADRARSTQLPIASLM